MEDIQDKIDNYLFGRMSNAEAKEFEQEVASDNAVREQFLFTRMVKHELSDRNEKLRNLQQWRKQTDRNRHPNPIRRVLWYSIGGFSAAAMVVLGVFLFRQPQSVVDVPLYAQLVQEKITSYQNESDEFLAKNIATASAPAIDNVAQGKYEKYMREVEYYQKQAENYRREAEYYKRQAEGYEREQEYHLKQAEKYQRNAADYSKRGDYDKAKTQTRYAQNEIDKAKTQANYARSAWDKYNTQMKYAKNADEKAAMYLKYAREALR